MMNSSVDVLSSQLKPLCSRDNHVMKYESGRSRANTGKQASYHCGSGGPLQRSYRLCRNRADILLVANCYFASHTGM